MDDSNRQNSGQGAGADGPAGDRPSTPPAQSPGYSPYGSPPQPGQGQSSGNFPPPPPPPPRPQPYSQGQGQQPGYPPVGSGTYNQPTEVYPVQGQGAPPNRYEQPTEVYPQQGGYGPGPAPGPVQGQGYPPQGGYPQQYGPPVGAQPPVVVAPAKKGTPIWAWIIPLVLVLAIGAGLIAWSVLQNQENERKAAAATATAQSQATSTAAQAEINRKATSTAVAQKTATAAQIAAEKHATSTAQVIGTATARAEGSATAAAAQAASATAQAVSAGQTATALALAQLSTSQTATALAIVIPPVDATPTIGGTTAIVGEIQDVTVDYDVKQDGVLGMNVHAKFTIDNAKDVQCQAAVYFYYDTGDPVKDTDKKFTTVDGQAVTTTAFKPGFDSTIYNDTQIFMPYDQIEVGTGKTSLKFQVELYVDDPYAFVTKSEFVDFTMTK